MVYSRQTAAPIASLGELADAVQTFADQWGGELSSALAGQLTCDEADAIVSLFNAAGFPESAGHWLTYHAESDEDPNEMDTDDRHGRPVQGSDE